MQLFPWLNSTYEHDTIQNKRTNMYLLLFFANCLSHPSFYYNHRMFEQLTSQHYSHKQHSIAPKSILINYRHPDYQRYEVPKIIQKYFCCKRTEKLVLLGVFLKHQLFQLPWRLKKDDFSIWLLISARQTAKIQSSSSFGMVFELPFKTVAVLKEALRSPSSLLAKSRNPWNTPGLAEFELSSWPRRGNSNFPQNFMQSILWIRFHGFYVLLHYV